MFARDCLRPQLYQIKVQPLTIRPALPLPLPLPLGLPTSLHLPRMPPLLRFLISTNLILFLLIEPYFYSFDHLKVAQGATCLPALPSHRWSLSFQFCQTRVNMRQTIHRLYVIVSSCPPSGARLYRWQPTHNKMLITASRVSRGQSRGIEKWTSNLNGKSWDHATW